MASTKSLEDMLLSSDIDESAVSALVGSLESQLSSDAHYSRNDLSTASINNNHITNPTVADCSVRIPDGQKHGALLGSLLEQGSSNTNKNLANSQLMGLNSVSSQNLSNAVIVSLPGALPASGYLTQVSSAQQALLNSSAVGRHVSSNDIKLVYSNQSTASQFSNNVTSTVVTSGVIATNQLSQNNFKVAALHNGNSNFSAGQIVTVTSGGPVISGPQTSTATLSAMQNLANIASQQPRIQVVSGQQTLAQQHLNALSAKGAPPRNQVDPKSKQNSPQLQCSDNNNIQNTQVDHRLSPSSGIPNHYQVLGGPSSVISSKSNQIPGQSINVVTQVVSNPNMLPPSVQIVNVNPARFGQKTLAPRGLVVGNQVRIAPQMIRQGTPLSGQGAITIPASMRGAIVVRADGSQYHVFNVAPPALQPGASNSPNSTYRLSSLPAGVPGIIRTISPQVVSVPVSTPAVKTMPAPQTVVSTVLQQGSTNTIARSTPTNTTQTSSGADFSYSGFKYDYYNHNMMSPNTIKKKCLNFLSTLIKLAGDQASKTANNVKKLIQNLIDGTIEPEEFSTQLQKELKSNPQPYLIHFLKKSLPHVRQSLMTKEMSIDGIRPPPLTVASVPATTSATVVGAIRPSVAPTPRNIITTVTGSALTTQLSQAPASTILTQRLIAPTMPPGSKIIRPLNIAPTISSSSVTGLLENSPATVGALQSKVLISKQTSVLKSAPASKEKKPYVSVRDEDDINDVAAMGGVNLVEESQRILATNSELVGTQIRSCKDENHFLSSALHRKLLSIAKKRGLDEVRSDVVELVSHAAEQRLKNLIEKLSVVAEHRVENPKNDPRYEVTSDTKSQLKFLEELDKLEKKRHDDQEKEILMKAAKSRSKLEDPELLKLKQKAKEMQRAEIEEMRQREANMTALLAIGPRKRIKLDNSSTSSNQGGSSDQSSSNTSIKAPVRPRVKRVNLRDLLFVMENEQKTIRRPLLYKYYAR